MIENEILQIIIDKKGTIFQYLQKRQMYLSVRNNIVNIESKRKLYCQNKIYSRNILCRVLSIKVPITYKALYFTGKWKGSEWSLPPKQL